MFYTYALISNNHDRIYIGLTRNLESRIREHNAGKTKSTKYYIPWSLFYSEEFDTRLKARLREKKLKSGVGREFLKKKLR
jgi:putative endonuclease